MSNGYDPTQSQLGQYSPPWTGTQNQFLGQLGGGQNEWFTGQNGAPGSVEQAEDWRLSAIGAPTQAQSLTPWEQNEQNQFAQQSQQSTAMLGQQYGAAQALAQGGPNTAGAQQLALSQGAQQAALGSTARAAGGGARGAASAAGTAVQAGQANVGQQAQQTQMQSLSDRAAGIQAMTGIAQQQQGLAQGQYGFQAQQGVQNAQYQQGWMGTNDQASQWANALAAQRSSQDLLAQYGGANSVAALQQQQALWQQGQDAAYMGAGISALGAGAAHA